ncbi:hypothetical protein [Burkholderia gladioli]|uniref:hypothetical protein n=1 Tax=Burkholderia gladioli TaxID=28095 RepID=UPI002FE3E9A4
MLLAEGVAARLAFVVIEHVRVDLLADGGASRTSGCAAKQRTHEGAGNTAED